MYLPGIAWRGKNTSYLQLMAYKNENQKKAVSAFVRSINEKFQTEDDFKMTFQDVRGGAHFSETVASQLSHSDHNMHVSLSTTLHFANPKAASASRFMEEIRRIGAFDKYEALSDNPAFKALDGLRGEPIKLSYKKTPRLYSNWQRTKIFLGIPTSDETNAKLNLIIDYIDSLVTRGNKYGIRVNQYAKYDVSGSHSSIAQWVPRGTFDLNACETINKKVLSKPEYQLSDELIDELRFETHHIVASTGRSLTRISIPR